MKWTNPHDIISGGRITDTDTDTITYTVSDDYNNYSHAVPHEEYYGAPPLEAYIQASNDREAIWQTQKELREDMSILLKVLQQLDDDNELKKMFNAEKAAFNAEKAAKILRGE